MEQQIANIDAEVLALETENAQLLTSVNNYETQISNLNNQIDEMVAELNAKNELWQKLMNGIITEITAEDLQGVTEIRPYAFYNCLNLTSVEIPEGITTIGEYAFQKCSSLENLTLCNSINTIGQYSFSNTAINNLSLPSELNSLGKFSFADCKNLSDIDFSKALSLTNISSAFQGSGMKKVILPSNILDITSAFSNCKELEEIVIGGKIFFTQPGFSGCSKLTKIVFNDVPQSSDIKLIGWGTPVKTIIFEIGFTGLYYDTFIGNCSTLEAIIVNKDTAPILFKIDDVSLLGNTKFYVPDVAVEGYKAHARWSAIADSILPMSDYESLENQEAG